MPEFDPKIAELEARLERLVRTQIDFQSEISSIRNELALLNVSAVAPPPVTSRLDQQAPKPQVTPQSPPRVHTEIPPTSSVPPLGQGRTPVGTKSESSASMNTIFSEQLYDYAEPAHGNLEKFIGKNLIALIGIIILVLGVGIGAKFAIDNGWVSPLLRICAGYIVGIGLIGVAVRLKANYHNFSAVLLSGGMSIMYFVTYFAYAYYGLMPQSASFALMAIFTIFTIASALLYDRQVIAHIGLVGAYAVPFLLSDNSGNYLFLFSYMAIINCGILAISISRYWKLLFLSSFIVTWAIFFAWFIDKYAAAEHFWLALSFSAVFFAIFYAATLIHGVVHSEDETAESGISIVATSLVFYGFGYAIMDSRADFQKYEGLFTAGHALMHSATAQVIGRLRYSASNLVTVLAALIITFVTIAVPVQFDGRVVTLVWTVEAAVLFWFGRIKTIRIFEYFAYPLMVLASGSLAYDWATLYAERSMDVSILNRQPILNGDFVTALVFVAGFGAIHLINQKYNESSVIDDFLVRGFGIVVGAMTVFVMWNLFRIEIDNYHHLLIVGQRSVHDLSSLTEPTLRRGSDDVVRFNAIWQLNYTMAFLTLFGAVNLRRIRSAIAEFSGLFLSILALAIYSTFGMFILYELRVSYMIPDPQTVEIAGSMNIAIRYVTYLFAAGLLASLYFTLRSELVAASIPETIIESGWDLLLYFTILLTASAELIDLMAQMHMPDSTKLGLSILWGLYALALIGIGIAWQKKHLRIGAIILLAITVIKLFIYDVADLPTIPKTILFVSLGILLLAISFLYNKFTARIFDKPVDDA
ncbi:MAG: DUF2339 domain-containing protein [Acidobacteriota bacterium]